MDVVARVARRLVELAGVWGTSADAGVLIQAGISQQELADLGRLLAAGVAVAFYG